MLWKENVPLAAEWFFSSSIFGWLIALTSVFFFFQKSQKGAQNIPGVCIHHGKKIPDVHEFVAIVRGLKAVTGGSLVTAIFGRL